MKQVDYLVVVVARRRRNSPVTAEILYGDEEIHPASSTHPVVVGANIWPVWAYGHGGGVNLFPSLIAKVPFLNAWA